MSLIDHPVIVGSPLGDSADIDMELLLEALRSLRRGDFSIRLPVNGVGVEAKVADTFNDVMDQLEDMTNEMDRISRIVGNEGTLKRRSHASDSHGSWSKVMELVSALVNDVSPRTCESGHVVPEAGNDRSVELNVAVAKPSFTTTHRPLIDDLPRVKGLKVLLAEDIRANQQIVARTLQKRGHTVEVAANGIQAVELATGTAYDVILMDVQMPEMDGYQATAAIRSAALQPDVPIIALTANTMAGDRQRCIDAGMDDYLIKPLDLVCLVQVVEGFATQEVLDFD